MTSVFWVAFVLGLAACAPPGIVTLEAVRRGMRRGFAGALLLELGSLIGDGVWAALALSGVAYVMSSRWATVMLGTAGVLLLTTLAIMALRDAWTGAVPGPGASSGRGEFLTGAVLSLSNPFQPAFWLGLGGTAAVLAGPNHDREALIVFFAGFMLAALLWCFFFAGLVAWGRSKLTQAYYRWVNACCSAALFYFATGLMIPILRYAGIVGPR